MKKPRNLWKVAAAIFGLVLLSACSGLQTYGTPGVTLNGGVVWITAPGHCAGVELWGAPGYFVDVDCT